MKQFLEKKHSHKNKFGCVMLEIKISNWSEVISKIDKKDLYDPDGTYGLEKDPHVTLKFGLHETVTDEEIEKIVKNIDFNEFHVESNGIGIFENKEFDVVKINVKSDYLSKLNKIFSELPNTDEFKVYKPHITIGYVKPGCGKKYVDEKATFNIECGHHIIYSKTSGQKIKYKI